MSTVDKYIKDWKVFRNDEKGRDTIAMSYLLSLLGEIADTLKLKKSVAKLVIKNKYKAWKYFCTQTAMYGEGSIIEYESALFGSAIIILNAEYDKGVRFCKDHSIPYNKHSLEFIKDYLNNRRL